MKRGLGRARANPDERARQPCGVRWSACGAGEGSEQREAAGPVACGEAGLAGGDGEPWCCAVRASRAAVLALTQHGGRAASPGARPPSGRAVSRFRWQRRRIGAMRGAGGTRDPAGSGLGLPRFAAAPASCPWGCVLGPGGWSRAPFCPRHPPPPRWDGFRSGLGLWDSPSEEEEEEEEKEEDQWWWMRYREYWDFPSDGSTETSLASCRDPTPARTPPSALEVKLRRLPPPWRHQPTAEEAERNAQELLEEEERAKRKAEKKKMKKKRQKDRKKQEKLGQEQKSKTSTSAPSSAAGPPRDGLAGEGDAQPGPPSCGGGTVSSGEEGGGQEAAAEEMEDELDLSCTFVSKARQKAGVRLPAPGEGRSPGTPSAEPGRKAVEKVPQPSLPAPRVLDPVPPDASAEEQSLLLAGRGLEAAQQGRFREAVHAFSLALQLNPSEHRLWGNRSYCYEKLGLFEEALQDAQEALKLRPGWAKGRFRQGKALRGLQRYAEAASTFQELLHQDGADAGAAAQLAACQALLQQSSLGGVPTSLSPREALEPPLPPPGLWVRGSCQDTDMSGFVTVGSSRSPVRPPGRGGHCQMLPPSHPARDCYPLWVGNITPRISKTTLHRVFSRFGELSSLRLLPERRCAFLNYARKEAAEAAFLAMQDAELEGVRLVLQLKHPSHATPCHTAPSPRQHPAGSPHWRLL